MSLKLVKIRSKKMKESFLQYFVANGKKQEMANVKGTVILKGESEEMLGVKYFENEKEAKLFAEIIADFMSDAFIELGLGLTLETEKGNTEWP